MYFLLCFIYKTKQAKDFEVYEIDICTGFRRVSPDFR